MRNPKAGKNPQGGTQKKKEAHKKDPKKPKQRKESGPSASMATVQTTTGRGHEDKAQKEQHMLDLMRQKAREMEETKQLWAIPLHNSVHLLDAETIKYVAQLCSKGLLNDNGPAEVVIQPPDAGKDGHKGKNITGLVCEEAGIVEPTITPMVQ